MTRAAVVFWQTLVLLALAEGGARIAEWVRPPSEALAFDYAPYRMLRMTRAPWPLNREGFRAREMGSYGGKFLVEFLGGSVCLGVGTRPGKTVPERLEEALLAAGMAHAAVLNLCQGGATSAQELAIFLEYGLPLAPQVVLSFDGANDLMHPGPIGEDEAPNLPYRNAQMRARFDGHHNVAEHLAMLRVDVRLLARREPEPTGPPVPAAAIVSSYLYTLGATRTLAESEGAWYALLLQPTLHFAKPWSPQETAMWRARQPRSGGELSRRAAELYGATRARLTGWSQARWTTVFDLTQVFGRTRETVYSDSVHFSGERGYQMLFEELVRQGLIGQIAERYRAWQTQAGPTRTITWAPRP